MQTRHSAAGGGMFVCSPVVLVGRDYWLPVGVQFVPQMPFFCPDLFRHGDGGVCVTWEGETQQVWNVCKVSASLQFCIHARACNKGFVVRGVLLHDAGSCVPMPVLREDSDAVVLCVCWLPAGLGSPHRTGVHFVAKGVWDLEVYPIWPQARPWSAVTWRVPHPTFSFWTAGALRRARERWIVVHVFSTWFWKKWCVCR